MEKSTILKQLEAYFDSLTPEELDEHWAELEHWQSVGPSVEEYIDYIRQSQQSVG